MSEAPPKPPLLARFWFAWGQSCAYWGNQALSKTLHQWAVRAWTRALVLAPEWPQPLLRRAVIRGRELDDYSGAVSDLNTLIEQAPDWAEPYLQRGILHSFHALQAAPQAIKDLERFLALTQTTAHAWRPDAERLLVRLRMQLAERGWEMEDDAAAAAEDAA